MYEKLSCSDSVDTFFSVLPVGLRNERVYFIWSCSVSLQVQRLGVTQKSNTKRIYVDVLFHLLLIIDDPVKNFRLFY